MSDKQHVGIDLGTSNCVMAFAAQDEDAAVEVVAVPQVVESGVVGTRSQLPSFLYLPGEHELAEGALSLPWDPAASFGVGVFARDHGGKVPDRLVHSAKSWLCQDGVDRRSGILPWGRSTEEVAKVSPVQASALYIKHLASAWAAAHEGTLAEHDVVLTVPASFDPAARDLTVAAAHAAGLADVVLLEEPQAALYAWLDSQGDGWREQLSVGDVVLVCDIGGGTTDFSLIAITESDGAMTLERVAVGEHILLGGDNMDYALAFAVRKELEERGTKLDAWQLRVLVQQARAAKEALLSNPDQASAPILIPNRGARLFKRTIKAELLQQQVMDIVLSGFFPQCEAGARPQVARRVGLSQLGLSYAADPAVTRHLAHFLTRHQARPTAVLFNGGVMRSDPLRNRIVASLNAWLGAEIAVLGGADLDLAVARGGPGF